MRSPPSGAAPGARAASRPPAPAASRHVARRVAVDAEEGLLREVLCRRRVAGHPVEEVEHGRPMTVDHPAKGLLPARRDCLNQLIVGIHDARSLHPLLTAIWV